MFHSYHVYPLLYVLTVSVSPKGVKLKKPVVSVLQVVVSHLVHLRSVHQEQMERRTQNHTEITPEQKLDKVRLCISRVQTAYQNVIPWTILLGVLGFQMNSTILKFSFPRLLCPKLLSTGGWVQLPQLLLFKPTSVALTPPPPAAKQLGGKTTWGQRGEAIWVGLDPKELCF